ncbi:hypothetical protein [Shewanella frigidimarina]|nr:hypothetical protein [Shewanella frigidimarina]
MNLPNQILERTSLKELLDGDLEMLLPNATASIQSELSKSNFDEFINNTYSLLDKIIGRIELHPIHREHDSEDRTTIEIVNAFNYLGERLEHEASYGGNCDLTSNFQNKYLWLGEAKIDYSNAHIYQGFRQLCDRYLMASKMSKQGALLIYCKSKNIAEVISSWKTYFKRSAQTEYSISIEEEGNGYFITNHFHKPTQQNLKIKHMAISLFISASDKSAVKRKPCLHSCPQCCAEVKPITL